jgi:UDP-glucose 4-epimerase
MKVLVTGYKGYIGSKLFKALKEYNPVGIDLKDGRDILHHLPDEDFDYVFHLAAFPRVQQSVEEPSDTFRNNAYSTSVLLEWAKNHNVKRVIFSSSSAVKGEGAGPTSPYGLQKLISEQECYLYSRLYGLDTVCLRYFNVYSEDQPFGGSYSTAICAWMQMIRDGKPLRLDGDGEQTRDFVHVDDVVSANIFCMNHYGLFSAATFDVGSGETCSLNKIKEIIDTHHNVVWDRKPERKGDVKHTQADISVLQSLGWKPTISLEEGLQKCFSKDNLCVEFSDQ